MIFSGFGKEPPRIVSSRASRSRSGERGRVDVHELAGAGCRADLRFSNKQKGHFFCLDAKTGKTLWTSDGRMGESALLLTAEGAVLAAYHRRRVDRLSRRRRQV